MTYFGIVVYNKKITDSMTYVSLVQNEVDCKRIFIYDNSNKEEFFRYNQEYTKREHVQYFGNGINIGLSKAYNTIIAIKKSSAELKDCFVTLDDDSVLSKHYLEQIDTVTANSDFDVYIPMVLANEQLISPSNISHFGKIKMIKKIDDIKREQFTAINSGVCYRFSLFNKLEFNESLFLDCVDHCMFRDIIANKCSILFLKDSPILQSFSRFDSPQYESRLKRFIIATRDVYIYGHIKQEFLLFFRISEFRQAFLLSIRYKNASFIKEYCKRWIFNSGEVL